MNKIVLNSFKADNSITLLFNSASAQFLRYTNASTLAYIVKIMLPYSAQKANIFPITHANQQKITCHCVG